MGKLCSQRATSALPRPGAPQAIGICHVAIATRAASKPVCQATPVIRHIPASSNRHSWPRGFLPRGLYDARPSWPSGGHWHASADGHPTNLNVSRHPRTAGSWRSICCRCAGKWGNTRSARCAAVFAMPRAPHDRQNPRRLQLKASSLSWPHRRGHRSHRVRGHRRRWPQRTRHAGAA